MLTYERPTATTTASRSVCPKCGTVGKSGKTSCCGRGGSWFRNCGSASNTKRLRHTWYEGILACKTRNQLKTVMPRQPNGAQRLNSSYSVNMDNPETAIAAVETFISTSADTSHQYQQLTISPHRVRQHSYKIRYRDDKLQSNRHANHDVR